MLGAPLPRSHSTTCNSVTSPSACRARSSANPSACSADGEKSIGQRMRLNVTASETARGRVRWHRQNRTGRLAQDRLRHRAQEQPLEPSPAMGSHHNQSALLRDCLIDDRRLGISCLGDGSRTGRQTRQDSEIGSSPRAPVRAASESRLERDRRDRLAPAPDRRSARRAARSTARRTTVRGRGMGERTNR